MQPITIACHDGYPLGGHFWPASATPHRGTVIINPATGVLARYYHYYARFLAEHGFAAITYDYRGIGLSRPHSLKNDGIRWLHWGSLDFDAVVRWARHRDPSGSLMVVGHSIGGFLPGFAATASHIDRMLTMGAQYAYWRDYDRASRAHLFLKWHIAMPVITAALGYFPGRKLGWLEDLPKGVAHEWSFRKARMEASYPKSDRQTILERFAAVKAPILAVGLTDDELGTPQAIRRALSYYTGSPRQQILLTPEDFGKPTVGHFDLFHTRHLDTFWKSSLSWLEQGINPWPNRIIDAPAPTSSSR